jgi:hypothetical protein
MQQHRHVALKSGHRDFASSLKSGPEPNGMKFRGKFRVPKD